MTEQLVTVPPPPPQPPPPRPVSSALDYDEGFLPVQDMRLAAALRALRATLDAKCPLEWVDVHESRESFLRNLESKHRGDRPEQCAPSAQVTWNFASYPRKPRLLKAFYEPMEQLDAELEIVLAAVDPQLRLHITEAVARLMMRIAHEALIQREWLANFARSVPENAKFDQIKHGRRIVRLGKRSSPELRQRYLSKLPPE